VPQLEQGEWVLSLAAACNFSHDGPQGGTKRKREGATSLPAKAVKKAKKEIMAMVIEEMKASEDVPAKRSNVAQASETLLALVRGARKKGAASMLGVVSSNKSTDFVASDPKPKGKAVLMMPRPWKNTQEFRPVNTSASRRKDPSTKESGEETQSIEEDVPRTENDDLEKMKMTKTDPLSIRKAKRRPLKSDGQDQKCLSGKDCKFRAKENEFEPGVSGSEKDLITDPVDLEGEKRAEERVESWNAIARERQAQDKTKRKTGTSTNPKEDPNQVRVTLTTLRDA
jgi:hypothetical protein